MEFIIGEIPLHLPNTSCRIMVEKEVGRFDLICGDSRTFSLQAEVYDIFTARVVIV